MLADALPDRFGSALVNAWMAEQGIEPASVTPLDRLAYAGDRAMGALSFAPPSARPPRRSASSRSPTSSRPPAQSSRARSTSVGVHDALAQLITVGSSAGGARAKAVIAYNPATDQMRSGQLHAPRGSSSGSSSSTGWVRPGGSGGDPLAASQPYCRDRVRLLPDGDACGHRDERVATPARGSSRPLHDQALRPGARRPSGSTCSRCARSRTSTTT